jgi:hypothetical protein
MSNDEFQQQNYWTSTSSATWVQDQIKIVSIKINEDLEKWFVATSTCPTVYKIKIKDDKII